MNKNQKFWGFVGSFSYLLFLFFATIFAIWYFLERYPLQNPTYHIMGYLIAGIVVGVVASLKKKWSEYLVPFFAVFQGGFVGFYSFYEEMNNPGASIFVVISVIILFLLVLHLYLNYVYRWTKHFKIINALALMVILFYLVNIILYYLGYTITFFNESTSVGISFSVIVVLVISARFFEPFHYLSKNIKSNSPFFLIWYWDLLLMINIIWLSIELFRLKQKL